MKPFPFEVVGHIMIINPREDTPIEDIENFAHRILAKQKNIKTVLLKYKKVSGNYRIAKFQYLLGEKKFETIHREYGASYLLDPTKVFFSPRLSFEHQRIANLVKENERVLNFFSGVGPFSISIALKRKKVTVYSIEINPDAYHYLKLNIKLNKCLGKVVPYLGDAITIVPKHFYSSVNRVLLPLPLMAEKALPIAIKALKDSTGWIHWQITERATNREQLRRLIYIKIYNILSNSALTNSVQWKLETIRKIRNLAPKIVHIAVDLKIDPLIG